MANTATKSKENKVDLFRTNSRDIMEIKLASVGSEIGFGGRRQISVQSLMNELSSPNPEMTTKEPKINHYSLLGYTSPCLSFLASPVWYLVWYCFVLFFQSMVVNGFINSSIASLEKRYKLSSKESSLIASMYDIGCILVVLPVSFYGDRGHKPMWVGMGAFLMGLGCFIYASPQFFSGPYQFVEVSQKDIAMCVNMTSKAVNCGHTTLLSNLKYFKYLFYLGQFCIGIGGSPLFTLGVAYIEEINDKRASALHVGISTAVTAIGPAVGYITLGTLLKVYVDIKVPSPYMKPSETEVWVGAWWIGFLLAGFAFFVISLPLIMFPKIDNKPDVNANNEVGQSAISSTDFIDISNIIKSIVTNISYICLSIATTLTMLSLSGISTYGPKYFESVFGLTSSSATITVGLVSVPTLATGALVGGILLSRFNWGLNGTLMFMAITTLVTVPLTAVFLMKCTETKMAGVNKFYLNTNALNPKNMTSSCNARCNCSQSLDDFRPSCGADEMTYFSPCFAGCTRKSTRKDDIIFNNCSCISVTFNDAQLRYKTCQAKLCSFFIMALCILGVMLFFTYLRGAPSVTATMRAVNRHEIAVALGCQSILSRILGSVPGPILFGTIIDRACIFWGMKCGEYGNCIKYDIGIFTRSFFLLMILITSFNAVCFIIPRSILTFPCCKKVVSV